jgi:hypothetical protein
MSDGLGTQAAFTSGGVIDPLAGIAGLSFWDHRVGVFQDPSATTIAANGDPVGGWVARLSGLVLSQATAGLKPSRGPAHIVLDNAGDILRLYRSRTPEYTVICKVKATSIATETRFFFINYSAIGVRYYYIRLLNELIAWSSENVLMPTLNQTYILRMVRTTPTRVDFWIDGVFAGSLATAQAADDGLFQLTIGSFAGIALADRVLTSEEIIMVENELASM